MVGHIGCLSNIIVLSNISNGVEIVEICCLFKKYLYQSCITISCIQYSVSNNFNCVSFCVCVCVCVRARVCVYVLVCTHV